MSLTFRRGSKPFMRSTGNNFRSFFDNARGLFFLAVRQIKQACFALTRCVSFGPTSTTGSASHSLSAASILPRFMNYIVVSLRRNAMYHGMVRVLSFLPTLLSPNFMALNTWYFSGCPRTVFKDLALPLLALHSTGTHSFL